MSALEYPYAIRVASFASGNAELEGIVIEAHGLTVFMNSIICKASSSSLDKFVAVATMVPAFGALLLDLARVLEGERE